MAFTKSLSLSDHLHPYLESYHAEGRSISALASRLFSEYFTGASGMYGSAGTTGASGATGIGGTNGAYRAAGEEEKAMAGKMAGIRYALIQQDLDRVRADLEAIEQELKQANTTFQAAAEHRNARRHQQETLLRDEIGREFADITGELGAAGEWGADPENRKKAAARYRAWARSLHLEGSDPISIINHRIAAIATRTGRPAAEVREAVYRHLPGIGEAR
ncbi:MAG: hypothetical protein XE11_0591 [Methanomicrobiales archaeon 53_19]|uniref:hypothetical protein n=1 Tax=Methanocalculus sp. TaxID=2004547 RepID=UPI00074786AB|nr:hypothetical protein [Methanocalculus sp.]KUK68822.1 MAG: hypothetical protein XD88_1748 [Methanocalculus sp. 52_23]KUL04520.1 MAG: hypothetical protein XE11_0591 [Methanomicrobiales archaeon 53_19]HIJ06482.1 hypothetical protein [Methanocalculus sp.]